jgi:lipopolysaccharide export system protein LptA
MVEIEFRKRVQCKSLFRIIILIFSFFIIGTCAVLSQETAKKEKKKVNLIYADIYEPVQHLGSDVVRVVGHVAFKQNETIMTCDSAYFFQKKNQLKAFSRVHINQGDTLNLFGNYLFYDGTEEIANVEGNVELIDKETHLYTRTAVYDVANKIARYTEHGKITNGKNVLTSHLGIYDVNEELFHFKDSIIITNPDYVMTADTMDYSTKSETVFFTGPSEVKGDSLYMYCEKGWYDTKNDVTRLWKKSIINNRQQIIRGDSLYYEKKTGFGEAFRNVLISDTSNDIHVGGEYARYFKEPENFVVTKRSVFIQVSDGDSLFLHADTISAVTVKNNKGDPYRLMRAYYGCRVFSKDLQSKCDSLSYSFQDSVIRLYTYPIIWSESNQLTSDSMAIFTKNRKTDKMELYNSAFIASRIDSVRYNQIKGRNLTGYFSENKLYRILVEGNGESVYYLEDKDNLIGVTHNKSASIDIKVVNGKINEITELQNPDGKLDPPFLNKPDMMRLSGFSWFDQLRPKNNQDIFLKFPREASKISKKADPKKASEVIE